MKIMKNLAQILSGLLMILSAPVFAAYIGTIADCDLVNIGPSQWRATFSFNVRTSGSSISTENKLELSVPAVNADGKPTQGTRTVANWKNVTYSTDQVRDAVWPDYIVVLGPKDAVIRNSMDISVDFSTANGGYPVLYIRHFMLSGGGQTAYYWVSPGLCSYGAQLPPTLPPVGELENTDPQFSMNAQVWELASADVADLPDVSAAGNGYVATIKNVSNNNLCISYVTDAVKNNIYSLAVTNSSSSQGGRNLFTMQGVGSTLFYNLQLVSNDGTIGFDYVFPAAMKKYIPLSQAASSVAKRSQMCWTPKINLFKNGSTGPGMHSDTLNFVISPNA